MSTFRYHHLPGYDLDEAYSLVKDRTEVLFPEDTEEEEESTDGTSSTNNSGKKLLYSKSTDHLTLRKFLELDKLTEEEQMCLYHSGKDSLKCFGNCKTKKCEYKCGNNFLNQIQNCSNLKFNNEKNLEKKGRKAVTTSVSTSVETHYNSGKYARFTPIEGNAYTIDFHPFIYSKLSADLLEKTKDIRGRNLKRTDLNERKQECRGEGGGSRGGNHSKDCIKD